jgi:hypothetical protein
MKVKFTIVEGDRTVIAQVQVNHIVYKGEARCHPMDKFSSDIGQRLAAGRALSKAGKFLQTAANVAVDNHNNVSWCHCRTCTDNLDFWDREWEQDPQIENAWTSKEIDALYGDRGYKWQ